MSSQVSVFVGGTQKSGTRSVSRYFRHHQNLAVHCKKEGHFFDQDNNFIDDRPLSSALDKYHHSFEINQETKLLCDITPDYIFRQTAVKRVLNYNPNAIWIILLRNPIERAYSAWNMEVNRKTEDLSFEAALKSELYGNPENRYHDRFQYIERSRYYPQLLNLWKHFPKSQCHIYAAESIWQDPITILNQMLKSLKISSNQTLDYEHTHKGEYTSNLSEVARNVLCDQLSFELSKLPAILRWNDNPWLQAN